MERAVALRVWRMTIRIAIAAILMADPARALDFARTITQYVQTSWTSESGLPQNSVHAVAQTTDGYVWLGTEEGLARFDGNRFTLFSRATDDGLASDYISTLAAGPEGTLWIGTDSGLSIYNPSVTASSANFRTITASDGLVSNSITAICPDRDGSVWVGSAGGLDRLRRNPAGGWAVSSVLHVGVTALTADAAGVLWVGTQHGLARIEAGHLTHYSTRDGLPDDKITAISAASGGTVWIGTEEHGIAEIRHGHVSVPPFSLPWKKIAALLSDRDGSLWISFDRHGIARLTSSRLDLYGASQGLPSDRTTHALFQDRERNIWVGLLDAGVLELRAGKFSVFGKPEGLSGNYVGNILQAQDGTMWIGADTNGLNHLLPDGRVEVWDHRRGLPSQAVFSLLQSRDGAIWAGLRRGGLARVYHRRVSVFHDPQAPDTSVNALLQDSRGNIWVGFFGKGLARFENGIFHHVDSGLRVSGLAESPDGSLWIATDGDGLQRLYRGTLTRFTRVDGLPSEHVMCVYIGPDGSVWAGTASGGLSLLRDGHIQSWTLKQGLPSSTIGSILQDNNGQLWMGADNGIFTVAVQDLLDTAAKPGTQLHPILYGTADGLRSRETLYGSTPCAWKDRDGRLWFATIRGAAVVDPAHIAINSVAPPVHIRTLAFDSKPVTLEPGMRLGPGSGNLQIAFAAPSFVAPDRIRFRYRLFGFDSGWTDAGGRHTAWYTNLPPGRYTFQVQAANSDDVWNQDGASFSFRIVPPLSRTPIAYGAYIVLAILLTWGAIVFGTAHFARRERELTRLVAERTAQVETEKAALEEARRELQIKATHDSLTGIFNRAATLDHLRREIARAGRENTTLGVLLVDLDHFKHINDCYGHLCGDDVIREAAARFRAAMRQYDVVGRYGGEEFLILLPSFHPDRSTARLTELLDAIRSRTFTSDGTELSVTCSIGVATWRSGIDQPDIREVIARADRALYTAKNSGRNRATFETRGSAHFNTPADQSRVPTGVS